LSHGRNYVPSFLKIPSHNHFLVFSPFF